MTTDNSTKCFLKSVLVNPSRNPNSDTLVEAASTLMLDGRPKVEILYWGQGKELASFVRFISYGLSKSSRLCEFLNRGDLKDVAQLYGETLLASAGNEGHSTDTITAYMSHLVNLNSQLRRQGYIPRLINDRFTSKLEAERFNTVAQTSLRMSIALRSGLIDCDPLLTAFFPILSSSCMMRS